MIPLDWKRYQLSQLINKALDLPKPIPFDFLVHGEILRTTLWEWRTEKGVGEVSQFTDMFQRESDFTTGRYIGGRVFRECYAPTTYV